MNQQILDYWKLGKKDLGTFNYGINEKNNLTIYAGGKERDLVRLVEEYGSPLEIIIPEIVKENVKDLRTQFESAIAKSSFEGEYLQCYPLKSSQLKPFVEAAIEATAEAKANLEVGSYTELLIAKHLYETCKLDKKDTIICNGAKDSKYLDEILNLQDNGYNVIPIIEAEQEYFSILEQVKAKGIPKLEIGLRAKTGVATSSHWNSATDQNIFGIPKESLIDFVMNYVLPEPKISFKILHCHAASQLESTEDINQVVEKLTELYCKLKAVGAKDLSTIDVGGGLSVPYDKNQEPYSLETYATAIVGSIKKVCSERSTKHPNIIVESGRRTVANAQLTILGTMHTKTTPTDGLNWLRVDGSFMNDLPDTWGVQQMFWYVPINGLDTQKEHLRKYWLAGMTCDSDDVYPPHSTDKETVLIKEAKSKLEKLNTLDEKETALENLFEQLKENFLNKDKKDQIACVHLPPVDRYTTLPNGEKLYIAFFDTGAYQDSISGLGGAHHCLIKEPTKIILKEDGTIETFKTTQDPKKILELMGWTI